jgi:hypothetical protein
MRYVVMYEYLYKISEKDHRELLNVLDNSEVTDEVCQKFIYDFHLKIEKKYKKLDKHITVCY